MEAYAEKYYDLGMNSLEDGDEEAAFRYFEQSAREGWAPALFQLGLLYENGSQLRGRDPSRAIDCYRQAADLGHGPAQFNLGYLYYHTRGREQEGLDLISEAAKHGDEAAGEFLETVRRLEEEKKRKQEEMARARLRVRTLPARKELFTIYSDLTSHPFLEDSADGGLKKIRLFTDEKEAKAQVQTLIGEAHPCRSIRIVQKDYLSFFSELYTLGVNALQVKDGRDEYTALLSDLVKRKDPSQVPEEKRPVENPDLQYAMLLYMQELRRKDPHPDPAMRRRLDGAMVSCMCRARYLLPWSQGQEDAPGRRYPVLSNKNTGKSHIPVFTDAIEYGRFRSLLEKQGSMKLMLADLGTLAGLLQGQEADGYLINPAGAAVPMPAEYVHRLAALMPPGDKKDEKTSLK